MADKKNVKKGTAFAVEPSGTVYKSSQIVKHPDGTVTVKKQAKDKK